jgi:hypothetical protein
LLLPAHVPAPQLASPLGAAFFFFAMGCLAGAGAVLAAGAAALATGAAAGASATGVVTAAALVGGVVALAAGAAAAFPALFAPQPAAEHDACPAVAGADVAGATSLAWTGCGSAAPHATRAEVPRAPRRAAR